MRSKLIEATYRTAKALLERSLGVTIYRHNTPWGHSLFNDIRRLDPTFSPEVIFDVGANVGDVSLRFARHFPHATIYAFEPIPSTFVLLQRNTHRHKAIQTRNLALGEKAGTARMLATTNTVESRILSANDHIDTLPGSVFVDVPVSTIDDYCLEFGIKHINLLKSDTEGFELSVLKGATQRLSADAIDLILVETEFPPASHNGKVPNCQIAELLKPYGFRCVGIYEQEYWSGPRLHYGNMLFVRD